MLLAMNSDCVSLSRAHPVVVEKNQRRRRQTELEEKAKTHQEGNNADPCCSNPTNMVKPRGLSHKRGPGEEDIASPLIGCTYLGQKY